MKTGITILIVVALIFILVFVPHLGSTVKDIRASTGAKVEEAVVADNPKVIDDRFQRGIKEDMERLNEIGATKQKVNRDLQDLKDEIKEVLAAKDKEVRNSNRLIEILSKHPGLEKVKVGGQEFTVSEVEFHISQSRLVCEQLDKRTESDKKVLLPQIQKAFDDISLAYEQQKKAIFDKCNKADMARKEREILIHQIAATETSIQAQDMRNDVLSYLSSNASEEPLQLMYEHNDRLRAKLNTQKEMLSVSGQLTKSGNLDNALEIEFKPDIQAEARAYFLNGGKVISPKEETKKTLEEAIEIESVPADANAN